METLIVYESLWGNTRRVAEEVARGAREDSDALTLCAVADAPSSLAPSLTLLVIGAPTHAFSLPTSSSRAEARSEGAGVPHTPGIREWLAGLTVKTPPPFAAAFDTRQGRSFLVGSAAKSIARAARRRALVVSATTHFVVTSREGPLEQGELERAFAWGRSLTAPR
ncbi:flavodoxin/nitric oxide synthase [Microbacterium sp. BG28]|uniref:flavodoxin family protein n=1 Tax=Microbacterium sp. BG28 TaxID=3097356 RepID=UPI002A598D5C|nr:flavodoxin/nitric oxide synthase [Microbacterium sp. BG28]MDY0830516.1 flavodoxin/nitric oxide synthase [Microbacterium sp. BG28]